VCGTSSLCAGADPDQACPYVARIDPNFISRDGSWCSLSLLEDLAFIVANEGTFSMKTHKPLRYVVMRTVGSVRNARRVPSARTVRAQATRGILIPALMLVSLGTGAAASAGHGVGGHVHVSAHQPAHSLAHRANTDSIGSCKIWLYAIDNMPWMYAPTASMPWMYAITSMPWMYKPVAGMPWMYAPTASMPWMYAITSMPWMYKPVAGLPRMYAITSMPWMYKPIGNMPRMYAPQARHASRARICLMAIPLDRGA